MSQQKKSLYDLYPKMLDSIVNTMRKMGSKEDKKRPRPDIFAHIFSATPGLVNSLDFSIMAEEYFWEKSGAHVIFPESEVVLDNFSRARFQMETSEGFALPFDSFMLAMPHGYSFMGTQLPGLLITFLDYYDSPNQTILPFCAFCKIKPNAEIKFDPVTRGMRSLSISYRDPKNSQGYSRMLISEEKIPALLNAKDSVEFEKIMGYYSGPVGVIKLDDYDLEIQFKAIKLIAALGVYHLATEGNRLKAGFPGSILPRMNFRNPDQNLMMSTLSNHTSGVSRNSPESHYRTWHIRQLRDERFYKGDYERLPRGSRYVFVPDSIVNNEVTPHTQSL